MRHVLTTFRVVFAACVVLLVLGVATWIFGAYAGYAFAIIAAYLLWKRRRRGSRQSPPGHAPGLARVVAGTGTPARIR